jgi:2-keto-4-pentenoate hydratase/2-oxohepta-3-ene-1,7-dioic acid hydratase in catechol pathway
MGGLICVLCKYTGDPEKLAVVFGKRARHVTPDRALDVVAGYTIFNDVSARDYQKRTRT